MARRLIFTALVALILLPVRSAFGADNLNTVLGKLDAAAANFHSTSADFEFDTVQTAPIFDKDVQKGTVYYDRKGNAFRMGVHIVEHNGKPDAKVYTYINGTFKLFQPGINQETTFANANRFESYVMLGFGASGKDLQAKWDIKDLGSENLSDGVSSIETEKLEMVAKDAGIRKNLTKVTIWVDPARAVSLKQVLDFGSGTTRTSFYSNIKVNQSSIPADAFTFKTNGQTTHVSQ